MKRLSVIALLLVAVLLTAAGCSRRRAIPTRELKEIFKESFLINAYYDTQPAYKTTDSLDFYRPVLEKYGYNVEDLEYTVGRLARKKSAAVSDVVELAIEELDGESKALDRRVAVVDTMAALAERMFGREVTGRDSIRVRRVADTARLRLRLPVEEGVYEVSYSYLIDSADQNRGLRTTARVADSSGTWRPEPEFNNANRLTQFERRRVDGARITTLTGDRELELLFGNYPTRDTQTPALSIDSLKIMYYLPRQKAIDSLSRQWLDIAKPYYVSSQSSGALRPDPEWLAPSGDRNP